MLIDFTALQKLIPGNGSINITVKKNKDGKLGVLYKSCHSLIKTDSSYSNDKEVKETQDAIEKATKDLDKVVAFADTPENLNASFEDMITRKFETERTLAEVITESTAALNERIKELKQKKTVSKPAAKADTKKTEKEEKKEKGEDAFGGGLFGSITTSTATAATPENAPEKEGSAEEAGDTPEGEEEADAETEGLQEAA